MDRSEEHTSELQSLSLHDALPISQFPAASINKLVVFNLMLALTRAYRLSLRNELSSILAIIICPAIHFRYFPGPVSMTGPDRRCPFQRCRTPWIDRKSTRLNSSLFPYTTLFRSHNFLLHLLIN